MRREKVVATMMCVTVCTLMCSCAKEETVAPELISGGETIMQSVEESTSSTETSGYSIVYEGVSMAPGMEATQIIEALGDDYELSEGASCAYQGMDKVYTYDNLIIYTYEIDEGEFVSIVEATGETCNTNASIHIGSLKDEVIEAYGEPQESTDAGLGYTQDGIEIQFFLTGSEVTDILLCSEE